MRLIDTLRNLVQNIAIIIIITTFLEMLLPNTQMRRYVRLVLGLFVIAMILNPITSILSSEMDFEVGSWVPPGTESDLETILTDGSNMSRMSQEAALEEYRLRLEQQIAALVKLVPSAGSVDVEVALQENREDSLPGAVKKVEITITTDEDSENADGFGEETGVESVEIGSEEGKEDTGRHENKKQIQQRVVSIITDFFSLDSRQVEVEVI